MRERLACAAAVLLVLAGVAACSPAAQPVAAQPVAAKPVAAQPAASKPAPEQSSAPAQGQAPTAAVTIGVVSTQKVAGAEIAEAEPVGGATILQFPEPAGPGARKRGTHPTVIFHGSRSRKEIALTFDSNMTDAMLRRLADGKVKSYANAAVVDELQKSHTPATFFLAGKWVEAYPQLTRRIAADPEFEMASHSWAHEGFRGKCYGLGTIGRADMAADVERSFQVLGRYTDHPTRFFRFPGGCYDAAALDAVAPVGCTVVEYDDVSGDAFGNNPARITADTVKNARPGSIAVLHITEANAPETAIALPAIIKRLRGAGYRLVTLGDLLA
ncbi:polysaccharide deacetylase family protein [Actinoplanes sp. NPDC051343]|uniref:polysaccharide deacetylase family protein n=1 Tax=Actinoplanes sp. NPDC051343 TaxID=3363906 RepID=UPI00378C51A4